MRLLLGHSAEVAHWVAERIPHMAVRIADYPMGAAFGPAEAIGVLNDDGVLVAGTVFHAYDPYVRGMEVSCAAAVRMWAHPEIICGLLRYPFEQAQCQRLGAVTPRRATSTRRFLEGLGFQREGSVRRGFGSDNAIVYGLLAEEWAAHRIHQPRLARGRSLGDGQEIRPRDSAAA